MILWSTWSVNFIIHHTKLVSISLLEAQLSELEFLCYDKLHTAKPLLLFKDTVDLQGQFFFNFFFLSFFFFFHVKPSIAIKTKISESVLKNIEKRASYLLKRIFGKKIVYFNMSWKWLQKYFRGKAPWLLKFNRVHMSSLQFHSVIFAICIQLDCE